MSFLFKYNVGGNKFHIPIIGLHNISFLQLYFTEQKIWLRNSFKLKPYRYLAFCRATGALPPSLWTVRLPV